MSAYYRKAWKSEDFHPGQNIFKPSGVTDTFVPPASFSLHLKYIQALWIWVKYVYPKIQGKSLLYGIKNVQKIYNHLVRLLTPVRIASLRRVEGFFPLSLSLSSFFPLLLDRKWPIALTGLLLYTSLQAYKHPEWRGPWLGPRPSEENRRDWSEEQLRAGETMIGLQAGSNKGATQAGQSFGATRKILLGK